MVGDTSYLSDIMAVRRDLSMNDVSTMGAYTFAEAARYVMAPAATIRWPSVICLPTGTTCLHMWLAC